MFQKLRLNRLTALCVLVLTVFSAVFVACKKDEENSGTGNSSVTGIAINTTAISANAGTSATCGGNITGDGGSPIIARGVCWDTLSRPTTSNNFTSDGSGIGLYSSSITGLSNGVTYYVRSYAINAKGTAYGNQVSFVAGNSVGGGGCPVVKDIDGNWYKVVQIGNQCWMAENLKTTKYRNGDTIPTNLSNASWSTTSSGAYAIYNNAVVNDSIYGKLYNGYAVADPRGLCPTGWHVPSDAEWTTLGNFLGGSEVVGGKLKAKSSLWIFPNKGATNISGFTGLPGGYRNSNNGTFNYIGNSGYWWSSTQDSTTLAWNRNLNFFSAYVVRHLFPKSYGFSVRCVRD
jgi:uncharacterized protein (TIGR02145 family)